MSHIDCNEKLVGLIAGKKDNIFDSIKIRGHGGQVKLKLKNFAYFPRFLTLSSRVKL